jgi:hypothetical protein
MTAILHDATIARAICIAAIAGALIVAIIVHDTQTEGE